MWKNRIVSLFPGQLPQQRMKKTRNKKNRFRCGKKRSQSLLSEQLTQQRMKKKRQYKITTDVGKQNRIIIFRATSTANDKKNG